VRLHWLGHVPFEDAANIGLWAEQQGHTVTSTLLYADEPLPEVSEIDALAVMGGPMNIYQHRQYPWLCAEKRFIEKAVTAGIPTIGVCLGAQLIAGVLGAKIGENPHVEIGWFPVRLTASAADSHVLAGLPTEFMAFHWHGDTFGIPPEAIGLAESDACANQAFVYGESVLGLQFHLEYSESSIHKMLAHCADELIEAPFVQTEHEIIAGLANVTPARGRLFKLLQNWWG
jgi:GMP synthase-like glutamine amidotransferase